MSLGGIDIETEVEVEPVDNLPALKTIQEDIEFYQPTEGYTKLLYQTYETIEQARENIEKDNYPRYIIEGKVYEVILTSNIEYWKNIKPREEQLKLKI